MGHPILQHPDYPDVELIEIAQQDGKTLAYKRWSKSGAGDYVVFVTGEAMVAGEATWLDGPMIRKHAFAEMCTDCLSGSPVSHEPSPLCQHGGRAHCTCSACWG